MYILQKHELRLGKINASLKNSITLDFHSASTNTASVVKPSVHPISDHPNRHPEFNQSIMNPSYRQYYNKPTLFTP